MRPTSGWAYVVSSITWHQWRPPGASLPSGGDIDRMGCAFAHQAAGGPRGRRCGARAAERQERGEPPQSAMLARVTSPPSPEPSPAAVEHRIEIEALARDVDELGHVSNIVYVRWIQQVATD